MCCAGVAEGRITAEDLHKFLQAATQADMLSAIRFTALVTDFSRIARGEGTSDLLLSYEL